jgi:hypothetical protein
MGTAKPERRGGPEHNQRRTGRGGSTQIGFGAGCGRPRGGSAETWLRERLAKAEFDPQTAYLTRWNKETKQVELVIGEFCEWSNGQ